MTFPEYLYEKGYKPGDQIPNAQAQELYQSWNKLSDEILKQEITKNKEGYSKSSDASEGINLALNMYQDMGVSLPESLVFEGGLAMASDDVSYQNMVASQIKEVGDMLLERQESDQYRPATPEELMQYGAVSGQVNVRTNKFTPIEPPSGMEVVTNPQGGVTFRQGAGVGGQTKEQRIEQAQKKLSEQSSMAIIATSADLIAPIESKLSSNPVFAKIQGGLASVFKASEVGDIQLKFDTINNANAKESLSLMRSASPTGGAIGQVTEKEWPRLEDRIGKLEVGMQPDSLLANLKKNALYQFEIVNGQPYEVIDALKEGKITQDEYNKYVDQYKQARLDLKIPETGIRGKQNEWTRYNSSLDAFYQKQEGGGQESIAPEAQDSLQRLRETLRSLTQ